VVDAAMIDGASSLMSVFYGMTASGMWRDARGVNMLDSGAPFYDTYETKDGKWIAVGSLESKFYRELLARIGADDCDLESRMNRDRWPELRSRLAAVFRTRTRDEWDSIMLGSDSCYAPVLSLREAPTHPHNQARETFVEIDGVVQPAPAPRFSRTVPEVQGPPQAPQTTTVLLDWGFSADQIDMLTAAEAI
jgi:alpha-methylacyl-CoA racemase